MSQFAQQEIITQSKTIVADALQQNISRYHNDEPLIPIEFLIKKIEKNSKGERAVLFERDYTTDSVTKDPKATTSIREIRAIYKLLKEIPDPEIRHIMEKTVQFYEQIVTVDDSNDVVSREFQTTTAPWDDEPLRWQQRKRDKGMPEYEKRDPKDVPAWIKELIAFNQACAKKAAQNPADKASAVQQAQESSQPITQEHARTPTDSATIVPKSKSRTDTDTP